MPTEQHILLLFPEIDPSRILFTPNFAAKEEYVFGLSVGAHVTLDSLYPLEAWPDTFKDKEIIVRIDPLVRV